MTKLRLVRGCVKATAAIFLLAGGAGATEYRGRVVDSRTGAPLASRVYLQAPDGDWLFVDAADREGRATPYREQWVPMPGSIDRHTTVTAHEFRIELPPGDYRLAVERGKEYLPLERVVRMGTEPLAEILPLERWADMASRGWYSGETHVHRRLEELPDVMLAEDLNVAFPVTYWTTTADEAPTTAPSTLRPEPDPLGPRRDPGPDPIAVDATHVMVPRNTEYEIFSVGGRRHVLGALFLLNHKSVFTEHAPPVAAIAEKAHRERALLDLDKHNWPWSFMLVPIAGVDLFELANNSVWRAPFGFRTGMVPPPPWMEVEQDSGGMTERGWLDFGFQTYYALLNCGFPLRPTAGTASGVHPVPLGHGRVYVHLGGPFRVVDWIAGLDAGRSFVTTGPMLPTTIDGRLPGHRFRHPDKAARTFRVAGEALSARPIERIEVVVDGEVLRRVGPANNPGAGGGFASPFAEDVTVEGSAWIAVRCFESQPDGRVRFAHTGPFHVEMAGEPVRPRRREVDWFIARMREEIERNTGVLDEASLAEYTRALQIYERIAERARD
ncbi:CehA/McbA family metallohydrolase [Paludisphaera soli]|uniref:CehA/McbA family metallohydrolase n=1 Tax=Paludisphaera soli TaxID=2712865 RepID=UPI0013EAA51E|nr:CehA/McbA family metallohydrolase [Paludisphaera soli]